MDAELVSQHVGSWSGWPDDVVARLMQWNRDYLLSFRRGPDFLCDGCDRNIKSHPNGNAVVRPRRKVRGVLRCEDCLIRLARTHEVPPDGMDSRRGALLKERRRMERLQEHYRRLEVHHQKLHRQIAADQLYIDQLEQRLAPDAVASARQAMREPRAL